MGAMCARDVGGNYTRIVKESSQTLRGADAIYVATAHQKSLPLISWDHEQLNRATVLFNTYTPATFTY